MEMLIIQIDDDGFPVDTLLLDVEFDKEGKPILEPGLVPSHKPEEIFHKPRYDKTLCIWVEGASKEEIDAIREHNKPQPSEIDRLKARLETAEMALISLMDFL
ncbi:hypothetical protein ACFVSW_20230 [Neobacillus sp. NPDC058068]|uniref:hypothetical protein n=1 Tax=Neobacillus sp. NPDC058068 TaxID=3346325 RepID=UPI0036DC7C89